MTSKPQRRKKGPLAPHPETWNALKDGVLMAVLLDFYAEIYEDERLGHFFEGTTQDWVAAKQHNFLSAILSGVRNYTGFRPRNAHHWMVISDDLFDYRENIMERKLREHGLPDFVLARIRGISEAFRKQIVKDAAFPRTLHGEKLPLDGYESIEMPVGIVCDGCEGAIDEGTMVNYHVRTGKTYCPACSPAIISKASA